MRWDTRAWWSFHYEGFNNVAVFNGGLRAWRAAGYETTLDVESNELATFTANRRAGLLATKEQVLDATTDDSIILVNTLYPDTFAGRRASFGRPGDIPSSINLPSIGLVGENSLAEETSKERYENTGVFDDETKVVTCCGGVDAATLTAFDLARAGRDKNAVYDKSMSE